MMDARMRDRLGHALTPDRVRSAFAVAAIHVGIGYALLAGLNVDFVRAAAETLRVFDLPVTPPPPPVKEPVPAPAPGKAPEGAAAPPNLRAQATPVVAPPPRLPVVTPTPVVAAVLAAEGSAPESGAADVAGPGTGAGGEGMGMGSGGEGDGTGDGGIVTRARHVEGRMKGSDYPRAAGEAGAEGTVQAHFEVGVDGRVSDCRVVRSSGNAELDATTCRLIERRFRYAPARDAQGRAVPDVAGWEEEWWIGKRRRGR